MPTLASDATLAGTDSTIHLTLIGQAKESPMQNFSNLVPEGFSSNDKFSKNKVVSAQEAVEVIRDGDVVAVGGFGGIGAAEELIIALSERFVNTGHPRGLTLYIPATVGDGRDRGVNRLAHEGLLKRVIAGHYAFLPKLAQLAVEGKVEGYNLPMGILSQMLRDASAKKPRTLTRIGLGTFVDPRLEGGKINDITTEDIVELMNIDGEEVLAFKPPSIDVAIIRGTTAEANGKITLDDEALTLDTLSMAMAAQNNGGIVIAQVSDIAEDGSLGQKDVRIPGALIDCISVATDPVNHMQTYGTAHDTAFSGRLRAPQKAIHPYRTLWHGRHTRWASVDRNCARYRCAEGHRGPYGFPPHNRGHAKGHGCKDFSTQTNGPQTRNSLCAP